MGFTRKHPGGAASACFAQTQPFWVNYPKQTAQQSSSRPSFHSRDTEMQKYQRTHPLLPKPTGSMMNFSKDWSRQVHGLLFACVAISHYGRHPRRSRSILPSFLPWRGAPKLNTTLQHREGRRSSPFCCPFCHRAAGTPLSCWQLQQLQFCFHDSVTSHHVAAFSLPQ